MELPRDETPEVLPLETAPPPLPRAPGPWGGIGMVVLYFLLQFGIALLIQAILGAMAGFKAGLEAARQHRKPDLQAALQAVHHDPNLQVVMVVVTLVAAAAVTAMLVRQTWPAQWSRGALPGFGFVRARRGGDYLIAIGLGVAILILGGLLTHLLANGHPVQQDVSLMAARVPPGMRVLLLLLVVCVAPLIEELVFRGVLLSGLASRLPVGWAILVSALIFGGAHLPDFKFAWYPVPTLVLMGVALAWLRVRSGSLWPSITLHATNNLVAAVAWLLTAHPHA